MSVETLSFSDLIDHLTDVLGGSLTDGANQRKARGAIQTAYRRLTEERFWSYLTGVYRLELVASYDTGTITFDKATNVATLAGGVWPSWAARGTLRVGNISAEVGTRDSDTALTLDSVRTFDADLAAGTGFTIYQDGYPLPEDFRSMCRPVANSTLWIANYVSPEVFNTLQRMGLTEGTPTRWTIIGDRKATGGRLFLVFPAPNVDGSFDFVYYRYPRRLVKSGKSAAESSGSIAGTNGSPNLVGTGTTWDSSMVGSVIRTSATSKPPDGVSGLNPYVEQLVITAVADATHLTVDTALTRDFSGSGFCITDLVDFAPLMFEALLRCCEWQAAIVLERGNVETARQRYALAARQAMGADRVFASAEYFGGGSGGGFDPRIVQYPDGTTFP